MDVVDLHCDLLSYLAVSPDRTPFDPIVRCSIPQLQAGGVTTQILAISSETAFYSLCFGLKQLEIFHELNKDYPGQFIPAFENASAFCIESEPLDTAFARFTNILAQITPLYIGITWNGENRFGGGCGSDVGLKSDGEHLLDFLSGKGIAVDFSHATDALARDTLGYIEKKGLDIPIMASHSNFRSVVDHERNLPDDIALEIIRREGLIGLVFYEKFVRDLPTLYKMLEYGLKLGGEKTLAFGADFFCLEDLSAILDNPTTFPKELCNSSVYPAVLEHIRENLGLSEEILQALASGNASRKASILS